MPRILGRSLTKSLVTCTSVGPATIQTRGTAPRSLPGCNTLAHADTLARPSLAHGRLPLRLLGSLPEALHFIPASLGASAASSVLCAGPAAGATMPAMAALGRRGLPAVCFGCMPNVSTTQARSSMSSTRTNTIIVATATVARGCQPVRQRFITPATSDCSGMAATASLAAGPSSGPGLPMDGMAHAHNISSGLICQRLVLLSIIVVGVLVAGARVPPFPAHFAAAAAPCRHGESAHWIITKSVLRPMRVAVSARGSTSPSGPNTPGTALTVSLPSNRTAIHLNSTV